MKTIKETKYLAFIIAKEKPKTKVISIVNKSANDEIGIIDWYSPWRQYCFTPGYGTVWNNTCLEDVNDVIQMLMNGRK